MVCRAAEELEQQRENLIQSIERDYNQRIGSVLIKKAQAIWKLKQLEDDLQVLQKKIRKEVVKIWIPLFARQRCRR